MMNCHHSRIERIIEHGAARAPIRICRHILACTLIGDLHDVGDAALAVLLALAGVAILPLRIQRLKLLAIEVREALFLQPPEDQFVVRWGIVRSAVRNRSAAASMASSRDSWLGGL